MSKRLHWPSQSKRKIFPTHLFYPQGRVFYLFHGLLLILLIFPYIETPTEK